MTALALGAVGVVAVPAIAFWTVSGFGDGEANGLVLGAPAGSVTAQTTDSMSLSFAPAAGTPSNASFTATGTDGKGCTTGAGATTCDVLELEDGKAYTFTAVATVGSWTSPASAPFNASTTPAGSFAITTPADGATDVAADVTVVGTSATGTTDIEVRITEDGQEPGAYVAATPTSANGWTYKPATPLTAAKTYTVDAKATSPTGSVTDSSTFTVGGTQAPGAPGAPVLATASDTGSSDSDSITKDKSPTFTGSGVTAGATIKLYAGALEVGTSTATNTGTYEVTASDRADGDHSFRITQTVGNVATDKSAAVVVTIDTAAPTTPNALTLSNGGGTGNAYINTANVAAVDIAVGYANNALNKPTDTMAVTLTGTTGTVTASAARGSSATLATVTVNATTLGQGAVNGSAIAMDLAGNESTRFTRPTTPTALATKDTIAPTVAVTGLGSGGGASKVLASGTATVGAGNVTVQFCKAAACDGSNTASTELAPVQSNGSWTVDSGNNGSGVWHVRATQTDAAGNTSAPAVRGPYTR